jgi:hypothetical protein
LFVTFAEIWLLVLYKKAANKPLWGWQVYSGVRPRRQYRIFSEMALATSNLSNKLTDFRCHVSTIARLAPSDSGKPPLKNQTGAWGVQEQIHFEIENGFLPRAAPARKRGVAHKDKAPLAFFMAGKTACRGV